jgi:phage shock protein PspC (stress-responsive transcriptional regulator)
MFCNHCGRGIVDDARLCSYCGNWVGMAPVQRRLVRPRYGRKIAGVCAGVAAHLDMDVSLVRLVWLLIAIFTGVGLLAYPIAWIVIPEEAAALPAAAGTVASS